MQTKARANSIITHEVLNNVIKWTVAGVASIELDLTKVSPEVQQYAAIHGLLQRVNDAAAMSRDTETGLTASAADKYEAMKELVEYYQNGATQWRRLKAEGEGGKPKSGLLKQCLIKLYPTKSQERIDEYLKGLTKKDKAALLQSPQVQKVANEIRSVQTKNVDAEKLLEDL